MRRAIRNTERNYIGANVLVANYDFDKPTMKGKKSVIVKKSVSLDKLSDKEIDEMITRLSSLPSEHLFWQVRHFHALLLGRFLREEAELLSKCLKVRFLRQDGDPASELLLGDDIDKLRHSIVWATTEKFEALLSLIQLSWGFLGEQLSQKTSNAPSYGFELFLVIASQDFDAVFLQALHHNFKLSPNQQEIQYGAIAKVLCLKQAKLTAREKSALKRTGGGNASWLQLILAICTEEARRTENDAVKEKLQDYYTKEGLLMDKMRGFYSQERKCKGDILVWEDQQVTIL